MEKTFEERVAEAKAAVPAIGPEAARKRQEQDPDTLFLDPRNAADIQSSTGLIPGAVNLPLAELTAKSANDLSKEFESLSRPIITACGAGPMGALAAHALKQKGFSNVSFMDGGTKGWVAAGFPTDK